ncbi:ATP-binding protein [Actinoplanes sp. NPDC049596]|uniref:ATP-binding protein n=1 Tax=unclassified Actinoplanes TaxID=2626549 RepID=UPI003437F89E
MARLGDVVEDVRWRGFVGRAAEVAAFDEALAGRTSRRVLFVHGPGGIGKTTLLLHLRERARRAGRRVVFVDGPEVRPTAEDFVGAVGGAEPQVLLVDGYEHLAELDGWLRRDLVPALPADGVVVLAGRDPPAAAWRCDPGWRAVVGVHPLSALDLTASAALLARAGIEESDRDKIIGLARGHPLALALLADVVLAHRDVPGSLAEAPDLISALTASVMRDAPSEAHLLALATCAKAQVTTEDLLRRTVGDVAPQVWQWLRDRPFVSARPQGLILHDLTREVLDAEFERRSPDRYRQLHRVIHDYAVAGLRAATGVHRQLLAQQLAYLHRRGPFSAQFRAVRAHGALALVPARPEELSVIAGQIGRQAGPESEALAREWFAARPEGAGKVVGGDGFAYHLLGPSGLALEGDDPVVRAILGHVGRVAPLRPGEQVDVARFLLGADGSQSDRNAVFAGSVSSIVEWCGRPLAWSFVVTVEPAFWGPFFDYLGFREVLSVPCDGRAHVVYGNDWRRFPLEAWLDLMNEREQYGGAGPPPDDMTRPAPLGREQFAAAVRVALHRAEGSALIGTALGGDAAEVRAALVAAVDDLREEPRGDRLRAVLYRTYVKPAASQEAAAEALGLPFSTYRRHLAKALGVLTERLWRAETGQRSAWKVSSG